MFLVPWYEVVLAAVYSALTQLPDRQRTTKVHMHAAIILLEHFARLQQTLRRNQQSQGWLKHEPENNQLYSNMNPSDLHE